MEGEASQRCFVNILREEYVAAFKYGELFSQLRKAGRPTQTIDIMVASIAFCLGDCYVITTDSDLLEIENLNVQIW